MGFASKSLEVNTDFGEGSAAGAQRRADMGFKVRFVCLSLCLLPEAASVRLFQSDLQVETFVCVFAELEHTHKHTPAAECWRLRPRFNGKSAADGSSESARVQFLLWCTFHLRRRCNVMNVLRGARVCQSREGGRSGANMEEEKGTVEKGGKV